MLSLDAFGNVGADPEAHVLENGTKWCKLSVASSKKIKGEFKTTWFEFRFWNASCDFVLNNVRKGDRVAIYNAELTCYKYKDDQGQERTMWYGVNGDIRTMTKPKEPQTPYEQFEKEQWF